MWKAVGSQPGNTRRHRRSQGADLASLTVQSDRYHEARETWIRLGAGAMSGSREHSARDDVIRARLRARIGPLARGEGAG